MRRPFLLLCALPLLSMASDVRVESITDHRSTDPTACRLNVALRVIDPVLETALDYHQVRVDRALDDTGQDLRPPPAEEPEAFRPLQVTRSDGHPALLITLDLGSPARTARTLKELSGSFIARTFRTQKIVIPRAFDTFGAPIKDSLLEAHGIEVQVIDPRHAYPGITDEEEIRRLMKTNLCIEVTGAANKIRGLEIITADFKVVPSETRHFGSAVSAIWIARADQSLPKDTALRLSIPIDPTPHRIEFSLEDIRLP